MRSEDSRIPTLDRTFKVVSAMNTGRTRAPDSLSMGASVMALQRNGGHEKLTLTMGHFHFGIRSLLMESSFDGAHESLVQHQQMLARACLDPPKEVGVCSSLMPLTVFFWGGNSSAPNP